MAMNEMMPSLDLITLPAGNFTFAALDYEPRRPRGVSIVAGHGYSSSKQNLDGLAAFLAAHGFRVLSLDFPGHKLGASGGVLRSLADLTACIRAAAVYARDRYGPVVYALGHSMGAAMALRACASDRWIAGAIAIATGYEPLRGLEALTARGAVDFRSSYVDGLTLPEVMRSVEQDPGFLQADLAGRPVLYIAAEQDMMIRPAAVAALFERGPEPKSFVTVASDHTHAADHSRAPVLAWLDALHPR